MSHPGSVKQWYQQKLREFLTGTVPTYPKMKIFNGKSTAGVRSVTILKDKLSSLFVAFLLADSDYYPNIREIFHILLTMPIGSVPCERSFSALRRLKQWNRTAMVEYRLALLHIHRDVYRRRTDNTMAKWK